MMSDFGGVFHSTRQRRGVDFGVPGVKYKVGWDFEEAEAIPYMLLLPGLNPYSCTSWTTRAGRNSEEM